MEIIEPYDVRIFAESQAVQKLYKFTNGFGASVIRGEHTYGSDEGLWEVAVVKFEPPKHPSNETDNYVLCYPKHICEQGDVLGWLNDEGVEDVLMKIKQLTGDEPEADHG